MSNSAIIRLSKYFFEKFGNGSYILSEALGYYRANKVTTNYRKLFKDDEQFKDSLKTVYRKYSPEETFNMQFIVSDGDLEYLYLITNREFTDNELQDISTIIHSLGIVNIGEGLYKIKY